VYILTDSNAHSALWRDKKTDSRGKLLEEFIFHNNLNLLNQGSEPTFQTKRGSSLIDLSLVSDDLYPFIQYWGLHPDHSFSDHRLIEMRMVCHNLDPILVRNIRNADFTEFSKIVEQKTLNWSLPPLTNKARIRKSVLDATEIIISACDIVAPLHYVTHPSIIKRWNDEKLAKQKKKVSKARKKSFRTNRDDHHEYYKELLQAYDKETDKAQKRVFSAPNV
jgi:hypothetical protein